MSQHPVISTIPEVNPEAKGVTNHLVNGTLQEIKSALEKL